ncbi:MAG: anaerobic ribonucleoside-triphosphate reductase [Clostridia bacterium]|nr:anaerobic ribonucleoside-triphosphate reductase [Clostridia bacterium]
MKINVIGGEMSQEEINAYVKHIQDNNPGKLLSTLDITIDGEFVDMNYKFESVPFERIRRITGYLVGTVDRFNNGKRAEEHDRVKHNVEKLSDCAC